MSVSLKKVALEMAIADLGKQEVPKGSNGGAYVLGLLKNVGIGFPAPWCMAAVFTWFKNAAEKLDVFNPVHKTGSVIDCWNHFAAMKSSMNVQGSTAQNEPELNVTRMTKDECLAHPELIEPGDQFFLKEGAAIGHTGIIERVEGHLLHTIDGNTNSDGSREGFEVQRKVRDMNGSHFLGVVRYV